MIRLKFLQGIHYGILHGVVLGHLPWQTDTFAQAYDIDVETMRDQKLFPCNGEMGLWGYGYWPGNTYKPTYLLELSDELFGAYIKELGDNQSSYNVCFNQGSLEILKALYPEQPGTDLQEFWNPARWRKLKRSDWYYFEPWMKGKHKEYYK